MQRNSKGLATLCIGGGIGHRNVRGTIRPAGGDRLWRVAVVTAGGTRGIGEGDLRKALQAAGYKVAANYGNDEAAQVQGRDRHCGLQVGRHLL